MPSKKTVEKAAQDKSSVMAKSPTRESEPGSRAQADDMSKLESRAQQLAEKRAQQRQSREDATVKPSPVSAGPVDRLVDVMVNPVADKLLEFTDLDHNQVTLIPQLAIIDKVWEYCYEIAVFRQDSVVYKQRYKQEHPVLSNLMRDFVFKLAQCRRSLGGKTLKSLVDLVLADLETRNNEEGASIGRDFED